jgi:hypothetical protein
MRHNAPAQGSQGQPFSTMRRSVRRHGRGAILLLSAMAWLAFASSAAASPPSAPFSECPGYGADSSCSDLIVINAQGGLESYVDQSQGSYDGTQDELVGVLNDSGSTVTSFELHGNNIFGFDKKGLCSGNFPEPAGCPFGPTRYEGPNTAFSEYKEEDENEEENANTGTVNFLNGTVAPGHSAYFTLAGRPEMTCHETHCEPTALSTELSGGAQSGAAITVAEGTPVSDKATLTGPNASVATGTVVYSVYRDSECKELVGEGEVSVTNGSAPSSNPEMFAPGSPYYVPGTYYWTAAYSGDAHNAASDSGCGSEVETLTVSSPCTKLAGRGGSVTGPPHVALKDNLDTNLSATEALRLSYTGGAINLTHLNSASCEFRGGEKIFSGKGSARIHKVTNYELSFSVTLANGHTYLTAVIERAHKVVREFVHEQLAKNKERIT